MSLSQADLSTDRPAFSHWIRSSNNVTQQFLAIGGQPDFVSLAGGLPAAELYPVEAIKQASARALDRWGSAALEYGPVEGFPALRAAIAERMSKEHRHRFGIENILLTTGAMQGLDLIGKVLIDPGDLIVAQFPTYLGALDAWRTRRPGYRKLDWNLDDPDFLEALPRAKFVYSVPNYSNPTGALVPQNARGGLLSRAIEANTWLVEDDPYLPLQLTGAAGPSILSADAATRPDGQYDGPVIYLGTLSKSVAPGLRVGWIVAEPKLIQLLALAKQCSDLSSSMFSQAVALEFLESGTESEIIPRTVACYRERRDALCASARALLSEWFDWEVPPGGMFLWARAKSPDFDTNQLYSFALQEKVAFVPSSVFDPNGALTNAMRVNFTRNTPERLEEGVRRLRRAVERYLSSQSNGEV
ncbi:MAG TPA: PLP-dependent aminotransferase family protein [Dongiaceae bacterium]|nr:PLP-dependent aminotransferase family protein [Dongiaceae bacterium]